MHVHAIAYTNADSQDGFDPGQDVLIAKLIEVNGDGVVSVGDKVITDHYPLDFNATAFGNFQVKEHTITTVYGAQPTIVSVDVSGVTPIRFDRTATAELYSERNQYLDLQVFLRDQITTFFDGIEVEEGTPSQADAVVTAVWLNRPTDDDFLDVDIFVTP